MAVRSGPGRLLVPAGLAIGPLAVGYLAFDKAFAYLRLPGTPLYVGDLVLLLGLVAVLAGTGQLRVVVRDEPILALLGVFVLWGFVRFLPGLPRYGIDAVRDAALWCYGLYAFVIVAVFARAPGVLDRMVAGLRRSTPWLLVWLPVAVLLQPLADLAPDVPGSTTSVLARKPGNAALAALVVLCCLWLFPDRRLARRRGIWTGMALLTIALAATQNRGGLLGAGVGLVAALLFLPDRWRLVAKGSAALAVVLALTVLMPFTLPVEGIQGRAFSSTQLLSNVASLGGADEPGNLGGTVAGRQVLWTRVYHKQVRDGLLIPGSGFGPNLALQVGVRDQGTDKTRNPHNSHLDVLARMGVVGLLLWIALWVGWYWRLVTGCRRLRRLGLGPRHRLAASCVAVASAVLVSSFFDPQLEGPQVAVLLWVVFGAGVALSSTRAWAADLARAGPWAPFADPGWTTANGPPERVVGPTR